MHSLGRSAIVVGLGACALLVVGIGGTIATRVSAGVSAGASAGVAAHQQAAEPSAASYLPDGLAVVLTVRDGAGLVDGLERLLEEYRFGQTPAYEAMASNPGFVQARIGLLGLAAAAQTDGWAAAASIAGDEMVLGITPGKGPEARFIAVTTSSDPAVRNRFLDQVRMAAGLVRSGQPDPARSRTIAGLTVFETDNNFLHGQSGGALIASNSEALFSAAVEGSRAGGAGPEAYGAAARKIPGDAAAWLFADLRAIKAANAGEDGIQVLATNPLGGLIFGGAWRSILDADAATAWLTLGARAARLSFEVEASVPLADAYRGFVSVRGDGPGFDPAALPGYLGDMCVTREWARLFADREAMLALPAAEQLVAFSNGLTTLMGQMDFVDDVLPRFAGPVYLVAARQDLSPRGYRPTPVLPAFALVMPLKADGEGDGFAQRLYSASVMAVSAANLIATQQGQPAFIINPDRYRDCRIVTAEYDDPAHSNAGGGAMQPMGAAPAGEANRVNIRYNFAPAIGIVGDRYIVATSVDLLRSVIDGVLQHAAPAAAIEGDSFVIDGPGVTAVLADNREELVAGRMLEQNRSKEEAEREIDGLLGLLGYARGLSASYRQSADGFTGDLELRLVDPAERGR